jgi:hypothetical protein
MALKDDILAHLSGDENALKTPKGHTFRDPGLPGYMQVKELTEEEREAARKAQEKKAAENAEALAKSRESHREAEAHVDAVFREGSADQRARDILTPLSVRRKRQAELEDARRIFDAQEQWKKEARTSDADGVTPEERAEMEHYLAQEEEEQQEYDDGSVSDWEPGEPEGGYASR